MRTRRGTTYWPGQLGNHINTFQIGDIVISTLVSEGEFFGVVRDVQHKLNKVMVAWGGGAIVQHDPEEVQLSVHQSDIVKSRYASGCRGRRTLAIDADHAEQDPQYVGDPEVNGLDEPRGGGFSIMQDLAKAQHKESLEQSSENPKVSPIQASTKHEKALVKLVKALKNEDSEGFDLEYAKKMLGVYSANDEDVAERLYKRTWGPAVAKTLMSYMRKHLKKASELKSRRAMYWCGPGRTYRMTRSEVASGVAKCPKCCGEMGSHRFTRSAKILICDGCGFKISSDKVLKEKPVVEAIPVEPEVTVASMKSRRHAS